MISCLKVLGILKPFLKEGFQRGTGAEPLYTILIEVSGRLSSMHCASPKTQKNAAQISSLGRSARRFAYGAGAGSQQVSP